MKAEEKSRLNAKAFLAAIGQGRTTSDYHKGQIVFSQGDPADSIYYIQRGSVKVMVCSQLGKRAVIAVLGSGDFFGEACLAGQRLRQATAEAISECTLVALHSAFAHRFMREHIPFLEMFLSHLLARNARLEQDLADQLLSCSERRLARMLFLLAEIRKNGKLDPRAAKISQETLAEMVGTTRSRISFFMNKFRRAGFFEYDDTLRVHSSLLSMNDGD